MIAEYDGNNNLLRKYIYGPGIDQPVCMIEVADSNAAYYYHFDALGSVVALSNASGDTVQTYEYSVYGEVAVEDANHTNPYMFAGVRYDIEIGLYYNRARYYNPFTGRFLQTDPIGYEDGMNMYRYCGNNPLVYTDPSGLWHTLQFTWYENQTPHLMVALVGDAGVEDLYFFIDEADFYQYIHTYGYFYGLEVDPRDIILDFSEWDAGGPPGPGAVPLMAAVAAAAAADGPLPVGDIVGAGALIYYVIQRLAATAPTIHWEMRGRGKERYRRTEKPKGADERQPKPGFEKNVGDHGAEEHSRIPKGVPPPRPPGRPGGR